VGFSRLKAGERRRDVESGLCFAKKESVEAIRWPVLSGVAEEGNAG
jgi:hypothetical protein